MFTSRNQVQTLNQSEGLPIGQFDFLGECNYIDGEYQVCKNDILMIYTDGLEDIRGTKENYMDSIFEIVQSNKSKPLEILKRKINDLIFSYDNKIKDDITYCLVKFK